MTVFQVTAFSDSLNCVLQFCLSERPASGRCLTEERRIALPPAGGLSVLPELCTGSSKIIFKIFLPHLSPDEVQLGSSRYDVRAAH